jgi:hypothetical protein
MMEARVGIRPQCILELLHMLLRMLALAVLRVGEPHGRRGAFTSGTIIAHISPEAAGFRHSVARSKHWNRRVVGMNLGCR